MPLTVLDAETRQLCTEDVQDERVIRFLYGTALGRALAIALFSRRWFSQLYTWFDRTAFSRRSIAAFIRRFDIAVDEFMPRDYASFNDFFIREFKPGRRPFVVEPGQLPATAEARYSGWRSSNEVPGFTIKQAAYTLGTLLSKPQWLPCFTDGPVLIARLAPQDYHRLHVVDAGDIVDHYRIDGALHCVNPFATARMPEIFALNKRQVTIQRTHHFGLVAYIDIGAMTVGSIVNTLASNTAVTRGDERGHFQFGGSTVVILGERGRWQPHPDILHNTQAGREVFVKLGRTVGMKEPA
ncbi:MAG TPA: phosphatidylserine decarboxylase [Candidatus Acidoferrum sp.]|nr:phosphatidylserine decarboxylase [Candidatus Acidoferrum sp.]